MAETATASVDATMDENRAACCHRQPRSVSRNTYSMTGTMSTVEQMTTRNANVSTCSMTYATEARDWLHYGSADAVSNTVRQMEPQQAGAKDASL